MCGNRRCLAVTLVLGLLLTVAGAAWSQLAVLDPARVSERDLPNGLRVVIKEERQWPVVAMGIFVGAGSIHEGPGQAGAAHMVEHMLFEPTDPAEDQLAPRIETMGGRIAAATMRDFAQVTVMVSSRQLDQVLPLLTKSVFGATIEDKAFAREVAVVKREMADRSERVDLYLSDLLWSLAFKEHPYGRPIGGTPDDLDRLTMETTRAFHRERYVPGNATVVVVGDVDADSLTRRLTDLTAGYPAGKTSWTPPPAEAPPTEPRVARMKLERNVSLLGFGWHAPGIDDKPGVCAMDLIYTLLGAGPSGRLNARLVDTDKVALTVEAEFLTQRAPGLLVINALVPRGREDDASSAILDEVRRLRDEPVSAADLDLAKRLLYSDYAFTNESYDDQLGSMGFYESIDSFRFALDYITQVLAVTPEMLQATAAKYLGAEGRSVVVLEGSGDTQRSPTEVEL